MVEIEIRESDQHSLKEQESFRLPETVLGSLSAMAPSFLKNFVPQKETRTGTRPLLAVLRELTWVQWALFFSG